MKHSKVYDFSKVWHFPKLANDDVDAEGFDRTSYVLALCGKWYKPDRQYVSWEFCPDCEKGERKTTSVGWWESRYTRVVPPLPKTIREKSYKPPLDELE